VRSQRPGTHDRTTISCGCLDRGFSGSKPTVKLKLAAVRMLYDFLVVRQITPSNSAHSGGGPKYVVKKGKSVWSREDAKTQLDSIPKDSVSGLRDLALIAAMCNSFARVSAVTSPCPFLAVFWVLGQDSAQFYGAKRLQRRLDVPQLMGSSSFRLDLSRDSSCLRSKCLPES
jgi:hypothetical protein